MHWCDNHNLLDSRSNRLDAYSEENIMYDHCFLNKLKVSSYIAQYPILSIAQSALHVTSLTDLFNQTASQLLSLGTIQPYATINA